MIDAWLSLPDAGKAGDVMAAKELLDRMLGKAKTTVAVETEPEISIEEARFQLKAMLNNNPSLRNRVAEIMGIHLLPGGTPPQCD